MSATIMVSDLPEVKRPVFKGLPEGWSWDYNKEGENLSVWKYFSKYAIKLEAEPRIKLIDIVKEGFEAKGKDLPALMKNAEKNCKTIEYKNFSQDEQDLLTRVKDLRLTDLKGRSFVNEELDVLIINAQEKIHNIQDNLDFFNFKWVKSFNQFVINWLKKLY